MLIYNLHSAKKGISKLTKPEKIYLQNPNLFYALCYSKPNAGNLRESFLLSQISPKHRINYTEIGDFIVDDQIILEVIGRNKTKKQIKNIPKAWLVKDNIETGFDKEIPLWLFGFLY